MGRLWRVTSTLKMVHSHIEFLEVDRTADPQTKNLACGSFEVQDLLIRLLMRASRNSQHSRKFDSEILHVNVPGMRIGHVVEVDRARALVAGARSGP